MKRGSASVAVSMALSLAVGTSPEMVGAQDESGLEVTGTASIEVAPDEATVTVGVDTEGEVAETVGTKNARTMEAVQEAVEDLGLDEAELETSGYRLLPQTERVQRDGERIRQIVGYRARNELRVTTSEINRAGEIMDAAMGAGATRIRGVDFDLADRSAAREEALRQATKNAETEARVVAETLGVKLAGPTNVEIRSASVRPQRGMDRAVVAMETEAAEPETPIEEGEVEIEADVRVRFELR